MDALNKTQIPYQDGAPALAHPCGNQANWFIGWDKGVGKNVGPKTL
jgi:hypothetical protein